MKGKILPSLLTLLEKKWVILPLAFVAFAWVIIVSEMIFPFYSNDHDEAVYILQARALSQGRLFLPANQFSETFFKTWFVVNTGERAIFKYTPVHAAFLALGLLLFGSMRAALGFVAAGNVILLYCLSRAFYPQNRLALLAAVFFLLSPFFLIQSITFLPYSTALLLHLFFAVLLLRGQRHNAPHLLMGAGLALGLAFFARPYDAILFAIPFGIFFVGLKGSNSQGFSLSIFLKQGGWVLAGFGPVFGLVLIYNYYFTGDPFCFPFLLWDPQDTLGFGLRGRVAILYDLPAAIKSLAHNLWQLNLWVFGGTFLLGLALLPLLTGRIRRTELTLLLLLVIFPVGYFFFWGAYAMAIFWKGVVYLGPMYYFPMLVPLVILGAQGLLTLSKRRPLLALLLTATMVLVNIWLLGWHIAQNWAYTREYQAIYRPFGQQQLENPALVFVPPLAGPFLLTPFPYLSNTPTFDGQILYALNRDQENFTLLDAYPERTAYRFDYYGPYTESPDDNPKTELVKMERRQVDGFNQYLHIVNPTHSPYVYVEVRNGEQAENYLLDDASYQGCVYQIKWLITPQKVELEGASQQHLSSITALSPDHKLMIAVDFSDGPERVAQQIFEWRYPFRLTKDKQLDILLPPEEWHNPLWPISEWHQKDIDEVMRGE